MSNTNPVVNDNQISFETRMAVAAAFAAALNAKDHGEFAGSAREAFGRNMAKAMSSSTFKATKEYILEELNKRPTADKKAIKGNVSNMLTFGEHVALGGKVSLPDRANKQAWEIDGRKIAHFGINEMKEYGGDKTVNFALSSVISAFRAEKKARAEALESLQNNVTEALSAYVLRHGAATDDALSVQIKLGAGGNHVSELDGTSHDYNSAIAEGRRIIAEERAANEAAEQAKAAETAYHQSIAMVLEAIARGDEFTISAVVAALQATPVVNDNRQVAGNA